MRFDSQAVHGGRGPRSSGSVHDDYIPHVPPIDLSSTYGFTDVAQAEASLDALAAGEASAPNPVYSRLGNPTVSGFERALAVLEQTEAAVAFSSGMAAITAVILGSISEAATAGLTGGHVVALRPIYGGTDHLLESGLLGTRITWTDEAGLADAVRHDTALVLVETPANPTLEMVDIATVVATVRAAERGRSIPVAVDSTFATPVLQTPSELGADLVIHSATKFLGGHGDVLGGVVATSEAWARVLRRIRIATGGVLHPLAGYLLHRGLQTLPLRVRAQQESARILAARLAEHPRVSITHYPGLSDRPRDLRLLRTQQRGPGTMISFRVGGGMERARHVLEAVRLITPAVSLGSTDSLMQAPALLTHRAVTEEARAASGVADDLLRLSVGLEDVEDLWDDLEQALHRATPVRSGRPAEAAYPRSAPAFPLSTTNVARVEMGAPGRSTNGTTR